MPGNKGCNMLGLAGVELISFIVTGIGLGFEFVLNTGLIIDIFLIAEQHLHKTKAFYASCMCCTTQPVSRLGCARS